MRIVWNVLLGLAAVASAMVLLFQSFAFPTITPDACLALRIAGSVCCQWFFLRITDKKALQAIPLYIAGAFAVWGFFLYLTSPSWLGATFSALISDYVIYAIGCLFVCAMAWLLPRIFRLIRRAIKKRLRSKKSKQDLPRGYGKQKKGGRL